MDAASWNNNRRTAASDSFYERVSQPDDVQEMMLCATCTVGKHFRRRVDDDLGIMRPIVEEDARLALYSMGFQVRDDENNNNVAIRLPIRRWADDYLSNLWWEIEIDDGALRVIQIVADAYKETSNFKIVESTGGRMLILESPSTGVTANRFEFDWIKDDERKERQLVKDTMYDVLVTDLDEDWEKQTDKDRTAERQHRKEKELQHLARALDKVVLERWSNDISSLQEFVAVERYNNSNREEGGDQQDNKNRHGDTDLYMRFLKLVRDYHNLRIYDYLSLRNPTEFRKRHKLTWEKIFLPRRLPGEGEDDGDEDWNMEEEDVEEDDEELIADSDECSDSDDDISN